MPQIRGEFGCDGDSCWIVAYGMNARGGVDEENFVMYVRNSIFPLYPNSRDVPVKRVLIKVDSG